MTEDSPPEKQPTRENIVTGIKSLLQDAKPGDSLFFYFSGLSGQKTLVGAGGGKATLVGTICPVDVEEKEKGGK
jgi:metacaspase-1